MGSVGPADGLHRRNVPAGNAFEPTPREAEVFKLIGKLIRMAIILSIVAMVFNKVVKPRMGSFEDDSA